MRANAAAATLGGASLLERDVELGRLGDLLESAGRGLGCFVLVEGEAGIGKTALLEAARSMAYERDFSVLAAIGGELEREFAWGVARQLYEGPLRALPVARRQRVLSGAARLAAPMLGLGEVNPVVGAAGDATFAVNHGLYWVTSNLADERPVVLVIDDAHWGDSATLLFLNYLGRRLQELSVLVVLALRRGEPGAPRELRELLQSLEGLAASERLRLSPLSERASARLIDRTLGESCDERFARACYETTQGNPFLLRELLIALRIEGTPPRADAAVRVGRLGPTSIALSVLGRLGTLWPDALELARAVAVLGTAAELRHAASLAGLELEVAGAAADALGDASILARERPLRFIHPIVRQAVSEDLSPSRRSAAHAQAARMLHAEGVDPEQVASHLLLAEPSGDAWVVERLCTAAERALAHGAPEAAVALLQRAVAEPPRPDDRPSILTQLGMAGWAIGHADSCRWLEMAVDSASDPATRVSALMASSLVASAQGNAEEAVPGFVSRAGKLIQGLPEELVLAAEAHAKIAGCLFVHTRLDAARHNWHSARTTPPPGASPAARSWLVAASNESIMLNAGAERAVALVERALASETLLAEGIDWQYSQAVFALALTDRLEQAYELVEPGLADARKRGSLVHSEVYLAHRSLIHLRGGSLQRAEADALASLAEPSERGWSLGLPMKLAMLIDAVRERGQSQGAEAILEDHRLASAAPPRDLYGLWLLSSRGMLSLVRGDAGRALADFSKCRELLSEMGYPDTAAVCWRVGAALAHQALGETVKAQALADEQIRLARRFGAPTNLGVALRVGALVHPAAGRIDRLREAVRALERGPARLEHAKALVELGCALRRANRRSDARGLLEDGMELAHRCRATPLTQRAHDELRVLGARPRRPVTSGVDALTASERRVAELAAQGMTNPEIAQALFVTRKTVEAHLGHVYAKVGIKSRAELPTELSQAG